MQRRWALPCGHGQEVGADPAKLVGEDRLGATRYTKEGTTLNPTSCSSYDAASREGSLRLGGRIAGTRGGAIPDAWPG